jgi:hypothetical protein
VIFRRWLWPIAASITIIVLVVGVFPTRTYFNQRDEIATEEAKIRVLDAENARLANRVEQLHTDAEIERLAREQYNLVRPGEEAYAILPGPADPEPTAVPPEPRVEREPGIVHKVLDVITFWD